MRARIFSRGTPTGEVWSDIAQHPVAHAHTPRLPREPRRGHVTFDDITSGEKAPLGRILRTFRLRMRTPFQGNPLWLRYLRSHPVAMPVMRNGTFCTTIVRKKRGNRLRIGTRSLPVTWRHFRSGLLPVTSIPVAPPPCTTTSNMTWTVLIYYSYCILYNIVDFHSLLYFL
jgi:hypothetical protein